MPVGRDIQRRIKSVKNTKKITKAMEMVSSAKMRKAVSGVTGTRPYSILAWQMMQNVASRTDLSLHPLLQPRPEVRRMAIVLITSNRGLCGSFNQQAVRAALEYIRQQQGHQAMAVECVALGRKGARSLVRSGQSVVAEFDKADIMDELVEIRPMTKLLVREYLAGYYDRVVVVYTDFVSAFKQACRVKQLLPIEPDFDVTLGAISTADTAAPAPDRTEYLFEPDPATILDSVLPRLLEVQVYQAVLESNASEHSARMMAMRNASDAAADMIDELTLTYNTARQAAITAEIAEISGGKAALE
ncbi:ATP synthase F1 subunit gamma [Candidatus Falkowbacteria bacterium]|nr:ATP synthase F1 subunit gamma [Candidatus Falkowbacteria bacterium]